MKCEYSDDYKHTNPYEACLLPFVKIHIDCGVKVIGFTFVKGSQYLVLKCVKRLPGCLLLC